ncbi:MAG: SDR family oxidoreductase [Gorillibacterium sp.]|nr:SDR family oxidoreductase [Gorillibacterium sp.]
MDKRLVGKIAVITGASSGIGAIMARDLSQLGAIPIMIARSEDKLRLAAQAVPGEHELITLDVSNTEQVQTVFAQITKKYGKIDILINSAGYGIFDTVVDTPLEKLEDMMNINYMGTVRCIKAVLPQMLEQGSGHIVNIASLAGKIGSAKGGGYSATKHAVLGFTNCLRFELAGTGVNVSAINPGPIDTNFFAIADPSGGYVKNIQWLMLRPEKVSAACMKAIIHRKAEINLPRLAGIGSKLYQIFPRALDKYLFGMLNQK